MEIEINNIQEVIYKNSSIVGVCPSASEFTGGT